MTPAPHCIGLDQPIRRAADRMAELHVRHIPVLEGGQLVGVLSERDIALIRSVLPAQLDHMTVEEAMVAVPYCVPPDAKVSEVARHMALRKLGSAMVVDVNGRLLGLFTTTDALLVLAYVLETRTPAPRDRSRLKTANPSSVGSTGSRS